VITQAFNNSSIAIKEHVDQRPIPDNDYDHSARTKLLSIRKTMQVGLECIVLFVHNRICEISKLQPGVDMPTVTEDAKVIYDSELKESMERDFPGQYIAIVASSRHHYVRPTFLAAALAARDAEPDHIPFVIRIGHDATFHIGAASV
jgi:hypothetical protein